MYSRLSLVVASALAFGCQGHQPKKTTQSGQQGKAVPASKTGAMVDGLSFKLKLPEGFRLLRPTEPVPSGLKDQFDQDALVNLERSDGILLVPNGKNPQGALIAVKRLPDAAPPLDTKERCKDAFASKPGAKKLDVTVKFETVGPYDACVWTSAAPKGQKPLQYTRAWLKVGNKALLASCRYPKGDKKTLAACLAAVGSTVARDRVRLDMYVMSKCPYGAEALRAARRVVSQLGQSVELSLDYIVEHKGGRFDSLHGQSEVTGNIQQLCAIKYHSRDKWLKFIDCVSEDFQAIPSNYETCAVQAKLDKGKMKTCVDGKEGKLLLIASAKRARALNAQGSPTIYIDGRPHAGGRSSSDLVYGACMAIQKGAPALCTKLPKPIVVKAVLIEDKRCKERSCDEFGIKMQPAIRARFFPGLSVERLDWSSPRAQALYKRLGLTALPSWIFAKGVKKARKYDQISRFLTETKDGEYLKLAVPASFDPKKEICDNKKDDTKNGKVDCADPDCRLALHCRPEQKRKVDVFVMSQCPYGVLALDAMQEVMKNFGDQVKFDVHYIADLDKSGQSKSGFRALHGDEEAFENMRQLCAKKHYAKRNKYLEYVWCRNKNVSSNEWKSCAKGGIKAAVIERCMKSGQGKKLLARDIVVSQQLSISASPTWLGNNRRKFAGITAEVIKRHICALNPGLKNCDKTLSNKIGAPAGSCGK